MIKHIKSVFAVESIRKKIIATLLLVIVYKFLSVITLPWVNLDVLNDNLKNQEWLKFFWALMWGWLQKFSVILMWLSPYINAMIILQLLWVIVPKLEQLQKEWEQWQKKITKMTRWLTLPIAFIQSYWMILLLNSLWTKQVFDTTDISNVLLGMLIITTWTLFLMWLWEIMTERWIGNGISIIITAWVLAWVPSTISNFFPSYWNWLLDTIKHSFEATETWVFWMTNGLTFIVLFLLTLLVTYIIIKFTEWNRRIPVIYTRTGREEKSYFPIRINQAWMIPIIFAISLVTFPTILGKILLQKQDWTTARAVWEFLNTYFSQGSWWFIISFFILVILFSFFYVSITFNTDNIAESIQKRWWYIPWIRPGKETSDYLSRVSMHLNLFGWTFLALIAVFPYFIRKISDASSNINFIVSWAWLIIIVSVVLDILRKIDAEMKMFDYTKYFDKK